MLYDRRTGIMALHGVAIGLLLPVWFVVYWFLYSRLGPGLVGSYNNLDLYAVGLMVGSLTYFSYYPRLNHRRHGGYLLSAVEVASFQTLVVAFMIFAAAFMAHELNLSRFFALSYVGLTWIGLIVANFYLPRAIAHLTLRKEEQMSTLIIGSSQATQGLWGWLTQQEALGVKLAGLVTEEEDDKGLLGLRHLGKVWELEDIFNANQIDQVILIEGMMSPERIRTVFKVCQRHGVRVLLYSYWEDLLNYPLVPITEGETTFFTLGVEPLENPVNRFVKRTFDIVLSLVVCVIILPPLFWWVKRKQKKESPGPLFFKQLRAGKNGKPFEVYKIRTMHVRADAAADAAQARPADPRVYKFGEWLRKTSLDELPQFINVIRGEMSVVGPRPHMLAHDAKFGEFVEMYRSRHFVKPGITGLAQVNGYRGEISELMLLEKRVRYDIEYITTWSLWMDIVIVIKTAWFVVRPQKSAY
jgi:putative colanic acid biosynthesis UDP-glucose lipid carrier transferase